MMRSILAALAATISTGYGIAAAGAVLPTNLPDAWTYRAPPPGFDPVRATPEHLAEYGFPPRPDRADAAALASWFRAMHAARHRIDPVLRPLPLAAGSALHARGTVPGTQYSQNWSALVLQNNANGYANGAFWSAIGWFSVPPAEQAYGVCNGGTDHLFSWVGIDGWTKDQVFQAGTGSDATCVGGRTTPNYYAWYEWYPNLAVGIDNFPVAPGHVIAVWMMADGPTHGRAFVLNATTNQYTIIGFSAPAGITLQGNSAEWVQERPYWNGVLSTLTNYVQTWMSDGTAIELGGNTSYTCGTPPPNGGYCFPVTMLDNNGQPISYPTQMGIMSTEFHTEGSAR